MPSESKDRQFIATLQLEGFGRSEQLLKEFSKCLERMLWNEFGEGAYLESMVELNGQDQSYEKPPRICSGDG